MTKLSLSFRCLIRSRQITPSSLSRLSERPSILCRPHQKQRVFPEGCTHI